jgi:2-aminoethylphosphonate-pyruvate transaminase
VLGDQVRDGLARLGIDTLLPAGESSVVLRAYHLPRGVDYTTVHDAAKASGFVVYAGQSDLAKTLFRISTMGALTSADMDRLIGCFAAWEVVDEKLAG